VLNRNEQTRKATGTLNSLFEVNKFN